MQIDKSKNYNKPLNAKGSVTLHPILKIKINKTIKE